jgi:hypothetical protein
MNSRVVWGAVGVLALLTFFQFPGHTYLQQDSQIYVPILENLRDPAVLRNDILTQHPHVAFTLYDEVALLLRKITGLGFEGILAAQQLVTRALGIWGLYLMASALGFSAGPALLVAAICSLGAVIAGPSVLTFEYEPTPRAFAGPLLWCAMGLAVNRRYRDAGIAGAAALLYHPPTAIPFWLLFLFILKQRKAYAGLLPLALAVPVLLLAARLQGGTAAFFERLTPFGTQLQQLRSSYTWISTWPASTMLHYLICFGIVLLALSRLSEASFELRVFWFGLPLMGLLSMPLSWLLLERAGWALVPQYQPMRTLLFVTLAMQFTASAAGVRAMSHKRPAEAAIWFALAYLIPLQQQWTQPLAVQKLALVLVLAGMTVLARQYAPVVAVAAFFAIPILGGVVNYPHLHTPELAQLSGWALASTPQDAVFLFPDAGRALYPGIFRVDALRAVYVDWKGGGQVNFAKEFGEQWWFRWQQTAAVKFKPDDLPKYPALGIQYVVLQAKNRLPRPAVFQNAQYVAYRLD